MKLRLDLDYRLKEGEEATFLDGDEADQINRTVAQALAALPKEMPAVDRAVHAQIISRATREAACAPLRSTWGSRVSSLLLRVAVERIKYKERIPRTEGAKTPGKWWGKIVEQLDDRPPALELSAAQALWLTEVWFDDAVQNGFEAQLQRWVNVLDEYMTRLKAELTEAPKE